MYNRLLLFYFTGTGNALAATHWIAQVAEEYNIPVEIKKITPPLSVDSTGIQENTLIGFCYPTHGFNAPPVVIDFMLRFRFFNWLITFTSLTKFKFWRRYFAPENYL